MVHVCPRIWSILRLHRAPESLPPNRLGFASRSNGNPFIGYSRQYSSHLRCGWITPHKLICKNQPPKHYFANRLASVSANASPPDDVTEEKKAKTNESKKSAVLFSVQKADLPAFGRRIYVGPSSDLVWKVKVFSLSTSALCLAGQPVLWQGVVTGADNTPALLAAATTLVLAGFIFLTPIMIHLMVKRYIKEIYYDPSKDLFTAISYSFWLQSKAHQFRAEDVEQPAVPMMLSNIVVHGRPMLVVDDEFTDYDAYRLLMGLDRPVDLGILKKGG